MKYQIKVDKIIVGTKKFFSSFGLIFEKKVTQLRLWGHAQSSAHPVIFDKHRRIVVFYRQVSVSFIYLSCRAKIDPLVARSTATMFSYVMVDVKFIKLGRI